MNIQYSVVIPVYNEQECLVILNQEVQKGLRNLGKRFEILFVDDGSTDQSREIIEALTRKDPSVRGIFLDRNRGQSTALVAGCRSARGEFVITMDADCQNNPADILRFIPLLKTADVVNGIRTQRNDSLIRKISSKIGNGFRNWMTNENISDVGCSLRIIRTSFLKEIPCFNGMHRFLPTLLRMQGARIAEVAVTHRPRFAGKAKYGICNRLFVGFVDVFGVWWLQRRKLEYHATYSENAKDESSVQRIQNVR